MWHGHPAHDRGTSSGTSRDRKGTNPMGNFGKQVKYHTASGDLLGWIVKEYPDGNADIAVFQIRTGGIDVKLQANKPQGEDDGQWEYTGN